MRTQDCLAVIALTAELHVANVLQNYSNIPQLDVSILELTNKLRETLLPLASSKPDYSLLHFHLESAFTEPTTAGLDTMNKVAVPYMLFCAAGVLYSLAKDPEFVEDGQQLAAAMLEMVDTILQ